MSALAARSVAAPTLTGNLVELETSLPARRRPRELLAAQRSLHSAASMPELLSRAAEAAREWCGFSRALVVSVDENTLTASGLGAMSDPGSDALRRRLLAAPVRLRPGSAEAEVIKLAEDGCAEGGRAPSLLQAALGLEQFALGVVMPEDRVLALLVLDRSHAPVGPSDRYVVQVFAQLLASSVERLVLRQRMGEFALEFRYLTASAQALLTEGMESPVGLPTDHLSASVFANAFTGPSGEQPPAPFTRRELTVVQELVAGRSNREIAAELCLSPETVKKYVARVIAKLGASNRGDAAVRYLRLNLHR
jgi:DNA-binding CsgD family transcriptional regulator